MFFSVYVANKIGSEGSGLFELITCVFMFSVTFANSGINLAATRIVGEEVDTGNISGIKFAIKKCILYSLFFGTFACALLFIFAKPISATLLHGKLSCTPIYIMAISLPFNSVTTSLCGYFSGIRKVSKTSFTKVLSMFFRVFITCLFLYIVPSYNIEDVYTFLVLANTISTIFEFLCTYLLYLFEKRKYKDTNYKAKKYFGKIFEIAFPVAVTSYVRSGLSTLKQMLIPMRLEKFNLSCDVSLSQYGLINGMTLPVLMFPSVFINSFASLLIPEFARYNLKEDYRRMNQVICFIFKITSFFSICIIGIFLTFTEEICYLIYHNYNIVQYIAILCPLIVLIYLDNIIDSMLKGLDEQINVMFCNIFDLFLSTTLIYFLLPIYGIYGYIFIIFVSEILNFSISLYQLYRKTKFKFDYIFCIVIPFLVVLVVKCLFDCFDTVASNTIEIIALKVFIFTLIYCALVLFSDLFNRRRKDCVYPKKIKF